MGRAVRACVVVLLALVVGLGAAQGLDDWLEATKEWEIAMVGLSADLAEYRAANRSEALDYVLLPEGVKSTVQSLSLDAIGLLEGAPSSVYAAGVAFQESSTLEDYARYQFTIAAVGQLNAGQRMLNGVLEAVEADAFEVRKEFFDLWTMFKRSWEMWM